MGPRVGELLVEAGIITEHQLQEALIGQTENGRRLASELLAMGVANERAVCEALAESAGHPALVLSESTIDLSPLELIPEVVARKHPFLPVAIDDETVTIAVADLQGGHILDQVAYATARRVTPLLMPQELLKDGLERAYAARRERDGVLAGLKSKAHSPYLEVVTGLSAKEEEDLSGLLSDLNETYDGLVGQGLGQDVNDADPFALDEDVSMTAAASMLPDASAVLEAAGMAPPPVTMPGVDLPEAASTSTPAYGTPVVELNPEDAAPATEPAAHGPSTFGMPNAAPTHPSSETEQALILVVEDDGDIRGLIRKALSFDHHHVVEADAGDMAISLLRQMRPHVVVLDAMLPGVHGFEICAKLKASPAFAGTKVIMVSAVYRGWEQAREIQEVHGADAFIEKPFEVQYLRKMVADLVGKELERVQLPMDQMASISALQHQARSCAAVRAFDDALRHVDKWLELDPFDPTAHLMRGNLFSAMGDLPRALVPYEAAAVYGPKMAEALLNLALTYDRLGFRRRALESYGRARAVTTDPTVAARLDDRLRQG